MTVKDLTTLFEIELVSPRSGQRKIGMGADGVAHIVTVQEGHEIAMPINSFTHRDALTLARAVMAGHERTVTDSGTQRVLAAAFILLDQQAEKDHR